MSGARCSFFGPFPYRMVVLEHVLNMSKALSPILITVKISLSDNLYK